MNIKIILTIVILFIYTGCTEVGKPKPVSEKESRAKIKILHKQVQNLDAKDKQLIYRNIQNEINRYNEIGKEADEHNYNYDAFTAFELVNFYEGYAYIPLKKIENIKITAKRKCKHHYEKSLKYSSKQKKHILRELNIVMMNNPNYKDAPVRVIKIKEDRDLKIYLNALESTLYTKLLNNNGTIKELKRINTLNNELLGYDYKNKVSKKANIVLKQNHDSLLEDAIKHYKKGKITKSKKQFESIIIIYRDDLVATKYLDKIRIENAKQQYVKDAQKELKAGNYVLAIKYCNKVLNIDTKNAYAKKIIAKSKKELSKQAKLLLRKGKKNYDSQNLDAAKINFRELLKIDPKNDAALIYSKKIQRQLETIKSLQ